MRIINNKNNDNNKNKNKMFKNYLFILNFRIQKYKRNYIIPLSELESRKKIKFSDFHRNPINDRYWLLMKYYAYLLVF